MAETESRPAFRGVNLPDTAFVLRSPEGVDVVLLGTAHISKKSADEARELVRSLRPDAVFLEVCTKRRQILNMKPGQPIPEVSWKHVQDTLAKGGGTAGLMGVVLASMTASLSKKLNTDTLPGAEFAAAAQEAAKVGCAVVLGDRDVEITLKRMWMPLSFWDRIRFIFELCKSSNEDISEEELESMKKSDVLTEAVKELSREFPVILEPLLLERDRVLTYNLRHLCRLLTGPRDSRFPPPPTSIDGSGAQRSRLVLAVVGMGHVAGIRQRFADEPDEEDFRRITSLPQPLPRPLWQRLLVKSILPVTVVSIGYVVYRRYTK